MVRLTISTVHNLWSKINSRNAEPELTGFRACAATAGKHSLTTYNCVHVYGGVFVFALANARLRLKEG